MRSARRERSKSAPGLPQPRERLSWPASNVKNLSWGSSVMYWEYDLATESCADVDASVDGTSRSTDASHPARARQSRALQYEADG
jgi:hypothetical protein